MDLAPMLDWTVEALDVVLAGFFMCGAALALGCALRGGNATQGGREDAIAMGQAGGATMERKEKS